MFSKIIIFCTAFIAIHGVDLIATSLGSIESGQQNVIKDVSVAPINSNAELGMTVNAIVPVEWKPSLAYNISKFAAKFVAIPLTYLVYGVVQPTIRYGVSLGRRFVHRLLYGTRILDARPDRFIIE